MWTQYDKCDTAYVQEGGFSPQTISDVYDVPHARPPFAYACSDVLIFPLTLESKGVIQGYKPSRGGCEALRANRGGGRRETWGSAYACLSACSAPFHFPPRLASAHAKPNRRREA